MIRKTVGDVLRFGDPSTIDESKYDHPFQWGSKRIGPDLARSGNRYPDLWHFRHMRNPEEVVSGSIMPNYGWLYRDKIAFGRIQTRVAAMKSLGVPYGEGDVASAEAWAREEAKTIAAGLKAEGAEIAEDREILALISYLQRLGNPGRGIRK
jgi:cytochrome c oxidase cbb3-type subunit I/II